MARLVIIFSTIFFVTACGGGGGGGKPNKPIGSTLSSNSQSSTEVTSQHPNSSEPNSASTHSSVGASLPFSGTIFSSSSSSSSSSSTSTSASSIGITSSSSSSVIPGSISSLNECKNITIPEEFSYDYTIVGTTLYRDYNNQPVNDFNTCKLTIFTDKFFADDQYVYYYRNRITQIDRSSAGLFDGEFIRDKNRVYRASQNEQYPLLVSEDSENFAKVGGGYYKDSRHVYYSNSTLFGADPTTFEMADMYLAKDKSHYWISGVRLPSNFKNLSTIAHNFFTDGVKIYSLDGKEEKHLSINDIEDIGYNYAKTPLGVYFEGKKLRMDFALETVEAISKDYLKDENNVYQNYGYGVARVSGADPKNVSVIEKNTPRGYQEPFLASNGKIFASSSQLPTTDTQFEILGNFYKDTINVFNIYGILHKADAASFHDLSYSYSKDAYNVFYSNDIISNADATTFVDLGEGFAKDRNYVYYDGGVIDGADPETFVAYPDAFGRDKDNVYQQNSIVRYADTNSFEYLGNDYFKDKNYLFSRSNQEGISPAGKLIYLNEYFYLTEQGLVIDNSGTAQTKIDAASFSDLHNGFFADKNGIYDCLLNLVTNDISHFSIIGSVGGTTLVKDSSQVIAIHGCGSHLVLSAINSEKAKILYGELITDDSSLSYLTYSGLVEIAGISLDTLQTISDQIITDGIKVFSPRGEFIDADPDTFFPLTNLYSWRAYGVDQDNVFYDWEKLDVDKTTFEIIDNGDYAFDINDYYYRSKKLNVDSIGTYTTFYASHYSGKPYLVLPTLVFYDGKIINGADPATFSTVGGYGVDANNVYEEGDLVEWKNEAGSMITADAATFRHIQSSIYADKSNVYLAFSDPVAITNVSVDTFSSLNYHYYNDESFIYYYGNDIHKMTADLASFEAIDYGYAKDKNYVYHETSIIPNADPSSFELLEAGYSRDSDNIFYEFNTSTADRSSFKIVDGYYGKDANNVYYQGELMPEADMSSFKHLGSDYMRDKDHVFRYGRIVEGADPETFNWD